VEALLVIGLTLVVTGLITPFMARQRATARQGVCLAHLVSHMGVISAYAADYKDAWPLACRITPDGAAYRDHPAQDFRVVGGIWHFAILDAYAYRPFHESLICPADRQTRADRDEAAGFLGVPVDRVGGTILRRVPMAMYQTPASLDPGRPLWGRSAWRVQRHADVLFPARKAALVDSTPSPADACERVGNVWTPAPPWRLTLAAADGSVALRSTADAQPGVLPQGPTRGITAAVERELAKFDFTAWGVRGVDW